MKIKEWLLQDVKCNNLKICIFLSAITILGLMTIVCHESAYISQYRKEPKSQSENVCLQICQRISSSDEWPTDSQDAYCNQTYSNN